MMETVERETTQGTKATLRCQFCGTWNRIDVSRAADRPKCGNCSKPMLLDRAFHLDDESFARTIASSEVPVMVDFYADWCGPCKMMAPSVDRIASTFTGRVLVAKLDTDASQRTASLYNVTGLPTTAVFIGGKQTVRKTGAMPYPALEALLASAGVNGAA
jgi:thioredoxin 2